MDVHAAGQRFSQHFFAFADHFLHLFAELPVIGQANKPLDKEFSRLSIRILMAVSPISEYFDFFLQQSKHLHVSAKIPLAEKLGFPFPRGEPPVH